MATCCVVQRTGGWETKRTVGGKQNWFSSFDQEKLLHATKFSFQGTQSTDHLCKPFLTVNSGKTTAKSEWNPNNFCEKGQMIKRSSGSQDLRILSNHWGSTVNLDGIKIKFLTSLPVSSHSFPFCAKMRVNAACKMVEEHTPKSSNTFQPQHA